MQLKHIFLFSIILNVALFALVFMQKGGYVSQAKTAYEKRTGDYYSKASGILEGQNDVIAKNALLWRLSCDALQQSNRNSKSFATLEKKIDVNKFFQAPVIKTDPATGLLTRKVGWNEDYYVVASFDKKTSGLKDINVDALLGKAAAADEGEDSGDDGDASAEDDGGE